MLSWGRNQWDTSSSVIEGASWKRFRYFWSSSVTWRMSRLSIGRRPGVFVLWARRGQGNKCVFVLLGGVRLLSIGERIWQSECLHLVVCRASWSFAGSCSYSGGRISLLQASWGSENGASTSTDKGQKNVTQPCCQLFPDVCVCCVAHLHVDTGLGRTTPAV